MTTNLDLESESARYDRFWKNVSRGILIATFVVVAAVVAYIKTVAPDFGDLGRPRAGRAVADDHGR